MPAYTVQSGDSLSKIAQKNGLTLQQLLALNPQFQSNPNLIKPGQIVQLGGGNQTQVTAPPAKTQAQVDAEYQAAVTTHPTLKGNTPEMLAYAVSTGDYSGLVNNQGQPFSKADQEAAMSKATAELDPYYSAMEKKDTADFESTLATKQSEYEKFLADQASDFQVKKEAEDQSAADRGVLFSGGRIKRLETLGDTFSKANQYKLNTVSRDIANTGRDLAYKYGDNAANSLSKYYNLGGNTYNPMVATGGVKTSPLSSVYNANQGFQGTVKNTAKAEASKRAAALLGNKANKLVASGYSNQF